jgi:hypothetical protein
MELQSALAAFQVKSTITDRNDGSGDREQPDEENTSGPDNNYVPFHLSFQNQMLFRMVFEALLYNCPILQATFTLQNPGNLHFLI